MPGSDTRQELSSKLSKQVVKSYWFKAQTQAAATHKGASIRLVCATAGTNDACNSSMMLLKSIEDTLDTPHMGVASE